MNEPIISPWLIYMIHVGKHISFVAFISGVFCIGRYWIALSVLSERYANENDVAEAKTVQKWVVPIGIVCLLLTILIPSEETCYQMLIASQVTPENINATIDGTENLAKRALELITDSVIKIIKEVN